MKTMKKIFGWTLISLITLVLFAMMVGMMLIVSNDDLWVVQPIAAVLVFPILWANYRWWDVIKNLLVRKLEK